MFYNLTVTCRISEGKALLENFNFTLNDREVLLSLVPAITKETDSADSEKLYYIAECEAVAQELVLFAVTGESRLHRRTSQICRRHARGKFTKSLSFCAITQRVSTRNGSYCGKLLWKMQHGGRISEFWKVDVYGMSFTLRVLSHWLSNHVSQGLKRD